MCHIYLLLFLIVEVFNYITKAESNKLFSIYDSFWYWTDLHQVVWNVTPNEPTVMLLHNLLT